MTNTVLVDTSEVIVSVNESNVNVNVCESITEVITGTTGPQGPRGTQILTGNTDPSSTVGLIGDQYINVTTGMLFGPKTESGWGVGVLLGTGLTIADVAEQVPIVTSEGPMGIHSFTFTHGLDFIPNIIVFKVASGNWEEVVGDYKYDGNTIVVTFSEPVSGFACLS